MVILLLDNSRLPYLRKLNSCKGHQEVLCFPKGVWHLLSLKHVPSALITIVTFDYNKRCQKGFYRHMALI